MTMKSSLRGTLCAVGFVLASSLAWAETQYGPGVSDTEIKIGNTMPYSGSASAYAVIGKAEAAYFAMVNDQGGVNGRKINFISRDDGYSPPKTVEVVRKLVEQDQVLLIFNSLGTAPNLAIRGYLNDNKVPHLFIASGAETWNDPKHFPWSMGYGPSYRLEGRIYGRYILKNMPDAKIGVLYQNDDLGKDYLVGLREGLADEASKLIVATQNYETSDTTTDSQIAALQGSGANTLLTAAIPKFAAQTIRKVYDIGWKPTHFLSVTAISVKQVMQPAGVEKGVGIISATYGKEVSDPQWHDAPDGWRNGSDSPLCCSFTSAFQYRLRARQETTASRDWFDEAIV
jgi:ABC-type branched-subunit amino acid transport system substrate-binding protein